MKLDFYQTQERKPLSTIYLCLLFCSSESRFSSLISFFFLLHENNSFRLPCICFQNLCHNFHKYVSCNGLTWIFVSFINLLFCISGPSQSTCSLSILFIIVTFCDSSSMNIRYFLVFIHLQYSSVVLLSWSFSDQVISVLLSSLLTPPTHLLNFDIEPICQTIQY